MRTYIQENLRQQELLPLYGKNRTVLTREEVFSTIGALSKAQRDRVKLIYGHEVHYGVHELFDRPTKYFTFVRHPVDRAFSFYNYHMSLAIKAGTLSRDQIPDFLDWLHESRWMENEMLGCFFEYGYHPRTTDVTDHVLSSILDKFEFVGLTEHNDMDTLFALRHFPIRRRFDSVNLSEQLVDKSNPRYLSAIQAVSAEDLRLFNMAVIRNQHNRAHPDYLPEVTRMRRQLDRWNGIHEIVNGIRRVLRYG